MSRDRYNTFDLSHFTGAMIRQVLRGMAQHMADSDLKACVMTAREHNHLSDEEAAFYIAAWGLANA